MNLADDTARCLDLCFVDSCVDSTTKKTKQKRIPFRLDMATLYVIVFKFMITVSNAAEEPSIEHARDIWHTALLLSWFRLVCLFVFIAF